MASYVEPEPAISPQMDVYAGVRWNAISTWGAQLLQFGSSVVLARLLQPRDYGLLAMATVLLGFLNLFRTMGFSAVVIQRPRLSESLLSTLFYVNFFVACGLAIVAASAAPVCIWIYHEPRVAPIMTVMSVTFIFTASAVVPSALLTRQNRFDRLAIANIAATLVSGAISITLALWGYGVWALVIGTVAGTLTDSALCHALSPWHPKLVFRLSEVRSVIGFGANVTAYNFFSYFARNTDSAIIGAGLGPGPLGLYSLASGVMLRPRDAVTNVVGNVLFPALSGMQHDDARVKTAYLRACGAIAFVIFPMMLGLLAVAHHFVVVVFGEKWLAVVPLIMILSPLGAIQAIGQTVNQLLLAKGRSGLYFSWGITSSVVYVCCFFAGLPGGVTGIALSYLITGSTLTVIGLRVAFRCVAGLTLHDLGAELWPYAAHSAVMAILVMVFRAGLETATTVPSIVLMGSILLGIVVYVCLAVRTRPSALHDFLALFPIRWTARLRPSAVK